MNSNAAARKRRGVPAPPPPAPISSNNMNNMQSNTQNVGGTMTIQQIIRFLDSRLVNLEKNTQATRQAETAAEADPNLYVKLAIEYNDRFNMMASEINDVHTILGEKDAKIAQLESTISLLQTMHFQLEEKINKMTENE